MDWSGYAPIARHHIPAGRQFATELQLKKADVASDLALTIEQIPDRLLSLNAIPPVVPGDRHYDQYLALFHRAHSITDGRLEERFSWLLGDIALLVSDDICRRSAGSLRIGVGSPPKNNINYQWIVIEGFQNVADKTYQVSADLPLIGYAYRLSKGDPMEPDILENRARICLESA